MVTMFMHGLVYTIAYLLAGISVVVKKMGPSKSKRALSMVEKHYGVEHRGGRTGLNGGIFFIWLQILIRLSYIECCDVEN